MDALLSILLISLLLIIFYQDLRYRAVSWIFFPALFFLILVQNLRKMNFADLLYIGAINCLFILITVTSLFVYFSLKAKKPVNIVNSYLGLGDILFLLGISLFFSPFNFILFYIFSGLAVVIMVVVFNFLSKEKLIRIPYAGLQALIIAIAYIYNVFASAVNFLNDEWILNRLV